MNLFRRWTRTRRFTTNCFYPFYLFTLAQKNTCSVVLYQNLFLCDFVIITSGNTPDGEILGCFAILVSRVFFASLSQFGVYYVFFFPPFYDSTDGRAR